MTLCFLLTVVSKVPWMDWLHMLETTVSTIYQIWAARKDW